MKKLLFIPFLFLLSGCSLKLQHELTETRLALRQTEMQLAEVKLGQESKVVHILYFKLKEDISQEESDLFLDYLKQLGELPYVRSFKLGKPADVPDPRSRKDYDIAMEMQFTNIAELNAYQQDSTHLAIRALTIPMVGAPPVVYDFVVMD